MPNDSIIVLDAVNPTAAIEQPWCPFYVKFDTDNDSMAVKMLTLGTDVYCKTQLYSSCHNCLRSPIMFAAPQDGETEYAAGCRKF